MDRFARAAAACCRAALLALLVAFTTAGVRAAAPAPGGRQAAAPPDTTVVEADAGGRATLVFDIHNPDAVERRLAATPVLPAEWRLVSVGGTTDVPAVATRPVFVQVMVPAATPPGTHEVRLEVRAAGSDRVLDVLARRVRVRERRSLEVVSLDAPRFAIAGSDYEVRFMVRNRGNIAARVRVDASEYAGFPLEPSWRDASLEPGMTREVAVAVRTRTGRPGVLRHVVELRGSADAGRDSTFAAAASTAVLVVPDPGDRAPQFHQMPLQARIGVTSATGSRGNRELVVGELSGGGLVADGSSTRAEFRVRGSQGGAPGQYARDEYSFRLSHPRAELQLGDHVYALSPLTEPGREAFGASFRGEVGGFSVTGLAARNRRVPDGAGVLGGGIGFGRRGFGSVTANLLARSGPDSGRIAGIRSELHASTLAHLDVEAAAGIGSGSGARAVTAALTGWHPRASYSVRHVDIPLGFPGSRRGIQSDVASLAIRVAGPLRVYGSGSRQRSPGLGTAWRQPEPAVLLTGEAGIGFGEYLSVAGVRAVARGDSLDAPGGGYESLVRIQARAGRGPADILATVLAGEVQAPGAAGPARTSDMSVQAGVRAAGGSSLTASFRRVEGPRLHSSISQEVVTASLRARVTALQRLTLDVAAVGTRRTVPVRHDFLTLEGSLSYRTPMGHTISLSAWGQGRDAAGALRAPTVHVGYAIPVGVPIGYSRTGSRLAGRVYDSETGSGVASAMVLVGEQVAVTDADGRFAMSGLGSGLQHVQLDLGSSAAANRVALDATPLAISMNPGRPARMDVALVRGATISGQVRRLAPESATAWDGSRAALRDAGGLAGILVTLTRDTETVRRLTDSDGSFTVTGLRPGRWTVAVDAVDAPEHHYIETAGVTVEVAPGEAATAGFEFLPRKRTLVMIDEAVVVAGQAPSSTGRPGWAVAPRAEGVVKPVEVEPTSSDVVRASPKEVRRSPEVDPRRPPPAAQPAARPAAADRGPVAGRGQSFYVVNATDRSLGNVAIWIYGDAAMWPKLWLANRHQLTKPDALTPGMLLLVPPRGPLTRAERHARDQVTSGGSRQPEPPDSR